MAIVYAVVNQKGGVGKTTTAVNLAACMALAGRSVLLIDLDPQGNATSGVGVDKGAIELSSYDLLLEGRSIVDIVLKTPVENLLLVPATLDLAGADIELITRENREVFLRRSLVPVRDRFDIILIDAPPSLGLLTLNALVAADALIIPIQTEFYALEGISQLLRTVELVRRKLNPKLEIAKVVLTMYDNRIRLANQVVDEVRRYFDKKVSPTKVPRNVRLSEAPSHGLPIALYDPKSRGAQAYQEIAEEVLRHGEARAREGA